MFLTLTITTKIISYLKVVEKNITGNKIQVIHKLLLVRPKAGVIPIQTAINKIIKSFKPENKQTRKNRKFHKI
jgi:hypothetical protein